MTVFINRRWTDLNRCFWSKIERMAGCTHVMQTQHWKHITNPCEFSHFSANSSTKQIMEWSYVISTRQCMVFVLRNYKGHFDPRVAFDWRSVTITQVLRIPHDPRSDWRHCVKEELTDHYMESANFYDQGLPSLLPIKVILPSTADHRLPTRASVIIG